MSPLTLIVILIGLALIFDFLNGFHDSTNVVATMISSRAMTARAALALAAVAEFVGPFLFGVAVAETIGNSIVPADSITIAVVIAALLSASLWNILTWYFGIPSSSSHALIGGILGAVTVGSGLGVIKMENEVEKIYRLAIADLFTKAKDFKPLMAMLRRREVYRHVANMSDRANDAANVVGMVVMKLT